MSILVYRMSILECFVSTYYVRSTVVGSGGKLKNKKMPVFMNLALY